MNDPERSSDFESFIRESDVKVELNDQDPGGASYLHNHVSIDP